mmetsp:Transcript_5393/g.15845  ORF Transcript_5393/g.15845 Transcript_5393/m.15845 type:complete len:107 (-) Transcript_5393:634-954(-)
MDLAYYLPSTMTTVSQQQLLCCVVWRCAPSILSIVGWMVGSVQFLTPQTENLARGGGRREWERQPTTRDVQWLKSTRRHRCHRHQRKRNAHIDSSGEWVDGRVQAN